MALPSGLIRTAQADGLYVNRHGVGVRWLPGKVVPTRTVWARRISTVVCAIFTCTRASPHTRLGALSVWIASVSRGSYAARASRCLLGEQDVRGGPGARYFPRMRER